MKRPAPPPDVGEIRGELVESGRLHEVTRHALSQMLLAGDYPPWDKVRFHDPFEGLSPEETWFAIRLGRRSVARPIPTLLTVHGEPFTYTLPDIVLTAVDQVARDASGHIRISEQVTDPTMRDRYLISSLTEEAITSSQLEGAATTRRVAKDMLRSGRAPRDRSELMIVNNYRAMQRIIELRDEQMTPELVREIQSIVTDGTLNHPENAGRLQENDADRVAVWDEWGELLHKPPPCNELVERLERLCEFANAGETDHYLPAVLRAVTIHFMVGYDHYFEDGNGRTARALFYWSMLRSGYWLTEFITISRILKKAPSQYGRSFLLTEQDEGDLTYFFIHHLNVINRAIAELHDFLALKAREMRDVTRAIRSLPGDYNYRQLALIEHAVRSPDATYTARGHSRSHRVSGETARHDLMDLEAKSLLVRFKFGRQHAWMPSADLQERLAR